MTSRTSFPFVGPKSLRRAAVVCHRNADADAYLSAYGVSKLLHSLSPGCRVDIATPEGMTTLTKKLAEIFPHPIAEQPSADYDLYVAVDVGDVELLKDWLSAMEESKGTKVLIDHHPVRGKGAYDHLIVDESATSTCEVVASLYHKLGVSMDRKTAQALAEGVLFDSQHLGIAGPETLRAVVRLLDAGADIVEARRALRSEPDLGEVMAKLKGSQRLKIFRLGPWVAVTSEVGSFQAQVARAMLFLGADVSAVGGSTEGETRVSLRATQRFADATKVQLGTEVAEPVARDLGGSGGGHATAASFTCRGEVEVALRTCVEKVAALVKAEAKEAK